MKLPLRLVLLTLLLIGKSWVFAEDGAQFEKVPDDYYIAQVPNLPRTGPFRLSWGFYRPPIVWLQGQAVDISKVRWPQFDKEQVPPSLAPESAMKAQILIEDSSGQVIQTVKLEKPFVPESFSVTSGKYPSGYRIKMEVIPDRLFLTTKKFPWVKQKEIFKCEISLERGSRLEKNKRLRSCLQTLKRLPEQTEGQWFVKIDWPEGLDNEDLSFVSENEREVRGLFRKGGHIYQSQRLPGRRFVARAGVTRSELIPVVSFPYGELQKRDLLAAVPEKEVQSVSLDKQILSDGSIIEAIAYPGDYMDAREATLPISSKPRVQVQFVPSMDGELKFRRTDFPELHTGVAGLMRAWQGSVFADYNQLSSNRGERNSLLDLPGFQISYKSNYWDLVPTGFYQSGLIHSGSSLTVSELQGGLKRRFEQAPWVSAFGGVHQYTLSGTNPGSSRLGKMNAIAIGLSADQLLDAILIRGRLNILYSNTLGYEGLVEYGKLLERKSDFNFFYSFYLGYSRYASNIVNKIQVTENFSEDRFRVGVSLGFLGPDSF